MSWSGGKDSALTLHHALRDPDYHVTYLLTSVNAHYQRVSMQRRTYQSPTGSAGSGAANDPFAAGFWYCDLLPGT